MDPQLANVALVLSGVVGPIFGRVYDGAKKSLAWSRDQTWRRVVWAQAAQAYAEGLAERYGMIRIMGMTRPIPLRHIYTDVYTLNRPSALRWYTVEALEADFQRASRTTAWERPAGERRPGVELARATPRLFILGKPGAGKTTFLKYLALEVAPHELQALPIFVGLRDWADSQQPLLDYVTRQFAICGFPQARPFVERLLQQGPALVVFDGLDEVSAAQEEEQQIRRQVRDFADQYRACRIALTCRVAFTDYTFEKFTYVEMADFTSDQTRHFIRNWFASYNRRAVGERMIQELEQPPQAAIHELTTNPLLLTLLCLSYGETLHFPTRQVELYEEALEALLKKWDSSRDIRRDAVYAGLSLGRKRQLLAWLAYEPFEKGRVFFPLAELATRVVAFVRRLPEAPPPEDIDGEEVIKSIEAQHGLLVERAQGVYSFSHLTFQEYFTARYLVEHATEGVPTPLLRHVGKQRWREVCLLTTALLPEADAFFDCWLNALQQTIETTPPLVGILRWAADKATQNANRGAKPEPALAWRREYLNLARNIARTYKPRQGRSLALSLALAFDDVRAFDLGRDLVFSHSFYFEPDDPLDPEQDVDLEQDINLDHDFERMLNHPFEYAFNLACELGHDDGDVDLWLWHADAALAYGVIYSESWEVWTAAQILPEALAVTAALQASAVALARSLGWEATAQAVAAIPSPAADAAETDLAQWAATWQEVAWRERRVPWPGELSYDEFKLLEAYLESCALLLDCLKVAAVADREAILDRLLRPPAAA